MAEAALEVQGPACDYAIAHRARQPYVPLGAEGYQEVLLAEGPVELVYAFRSKGRGNFPDAVPDGCVDAFFGVGPDGVVATIGGTVLGAKPWAFEGERDWVGCRFRPGQAILPQGVCPEDLVNADMPLDIGSLDERLEQDLERAADAQERIRVLQRHLRRLVSQESRSSSLHSRTPLERFASRRIVESGGTLTVSAIAKEAGVTDRRLRSVFSQVHGFSPKQFSRIVRFQHAMALICAPGDQAEIQSLATACGYSDQSHLVHEFNAFAGTTPGRFRQLVRMREAKAN
ncbi:MAG: helix-turn-helix domain-containing protein [Atopobiaceae bacterium]